MKFTQRELTILNCLVQIQERNYQKEQYEMERDIKGPWTEKQISHYDDIGYLINEMLTLEDKIKQLQKIERK